MRLGFLEHPVLPRRLALSELWEQLVLPERLGLLVLYLQLEQLGRREILQQLERLVPSGQQVRQGPRPLLAALPAAPVVPPN